MLDRLSMLPSGYSNASLVTLRDEATRFVEITMPMTIKNEFVFALPLRGGEIIKNAGTVNCIAIMPSQRLRAGLTAVPLGRLVPAPEATRLPPL